MFGQDWVVPIEPIFWKTTIVNYRSLDIYYSINDRKKKRRKKSYMPNYPEIFKNIFHFYIIKNPYVLPNPK